MKIIEKIKTHIAGAIFESDGITDFVAQIAAHFVRHSFGYAHGGHTSRLRAANHPVPCEISFKLIEEHLKISNFNYLL